MNMILLIYLLQRVDKVKNKLKLLISEKRRLKQLKEDIRATCNNFQKRSNNKRSKVNV